MVEKSKKTRKKKPNPHKREFGIEIVKGDNYYNDIKHKIAIDIGFRTAGLTWLNMKTLEIKCLNYKKKKDCKVQGMKIVNLLNLCRDTIKDYIALFPNEVLNNIKNTQIILEEPLIIAGQRSFSISLYILLSQLIKYFIKDLQVHSVCLVVPGSAKKLLGFKSNVHMPDSEKTKFVKENIPEAECRNNHCADSVFSIILTNQEVLSKKYKFMELLNKVDYKVYESCLQGD